MYRLALPLILFVSAVAAGPHSLSSDYKTCSRSDSDLNKCLQSAIEGAIKFLSREGDSKLGVTPLDPLFIPTLGINQGSGPVAINLTLTNLYVNGITRIGVSSVDAKLTEEEKTIDIKFSVPGTLLLKGSYKISGKVLVLPIRGEGDAELGLIDVDAALKLTGKLVKHKGSEFLVFHNVEFTMQPTNAEIKLNNLFDGDKALGDNMNKFLNENWPIVYDELKSSVQAAFAKFIIGPVTKVFEKVPFDSIFRP